MKRKIVCTWMVLALAVPLAWYNHQYHRYGYPFLTTPSGLFYKAMGVGNGRTVKDSEWISLSFVIKVIVKGVEKGAQGSPKESILINQEKPCFLRFDQSFQSIDQQMAEIIGMIQEKQRMVVKCIPKCYLEKNNPGFLGQLIKQLNLNKEDEIVIDIKLDKIMTDEVYNQMLEIGRAEQLAKDKQLITEYLATHGIEASSTDSGLFYIIDQPSKDTPVVQHKTVKVYYTGRLLDGTIFDTNLKEVAKANNSYDAQRPYEPFAFQVGAGHVIPGWDEGLLLLKKHEKARFFIPSTLAYGAEAMGKLIPANAILLFEVEVVDVS